MVQSKANEVDRHNLQPKKFIMWLFMVSSIIFFAGLTSGFIVYSGDGVGKTLNVPLPKIFMFSTAIIIITFHQIRVQTISLLFALPVLHRLLQTLAAMLNLVPPQASLHQ